MLMTEIKRESVGTVNFDEITIGVGAEAAELLGYEVLQKKQLEVTEDTPIMAALAVLGIDILNVDDVKRYQHEHQREVAQKSFAEWLVMPISERRSVSYNSPNWRTTTDIKEYKEPVPEFVLHKAIQIKKSVPECRVMIEWLDESPDPFLVIQTYMENVYSTPKEKYYVEVWNEPKFEGRVR